MTDVDAAAEAALEQLEEEGIGLGEFIGQWEFVDRLPDDEQVIALLRTLKPTWGIEYADYADFVIPLPSNKKVKVDREVNGRTQKVEEYHSIVTLYFGVAGRLKMLNDAAEKHDWTVNLVPEQTTPHVPGFVQMDERIVYREYIEIADKEGRSLGSKPGTAWVPSSGGSQAAGSNPYEKVETSARGRALAAWGFGVIPGSGVASLEEMQATTGNRKALQAERDAKVGVATGRKSRADLEEELRTEMERLRQARGDDAEVMITRMDEYTTRAFGKTVIVRSEQGVETLDFGPLKDGQVQLTINQVVDARKKTEADGGPV